MALDFSGPGSGDHIDCGLVDLPSGLSECTIIAWCLFKDTLTDQRVISKATDQQVVDHWFMFSGWSSTQMRARLKTSGTTLTHFDNASAITLNQWYHMGFVYDGSNVIFYRDGAQNGSSAQSGTIDTSGSVECRIADNPGPTRKEMNGCVEDCRIYTRALSAAEIQTIYAARGHDSIYDGLLHRWTINDGVAGTTASGSDSVKDIVGGFHGTPAGTPTYTASELTFRRRAA